MRICCAVNCTNSCSLGSGKSFYRFPFHKPDLLWKWAFNVGREKWKPSQYTVLCSDHFEDDCFEGKAESIRLRPDAVPTLFGFPPRLIKNFPLIMMSDWFRPPRLRRNLKPKKKKVRLLHENPTVIPTQKATNGGLQGVISFDHDYCRENISKRIHMQLKRSRALLASSRKRLKLLQGNVGRLRKKVVTLRQMIKDVEKPSPSSPLVGSKCVDVQLRDDVPV